MVSSEDMHLGRVFNLEGEQQANGFDALSPSIDVIAQEEIAGFWWQSAVFEEPEHVVVLPVDVSADLDGSADFEQHGLLKEDALDNPDQPEYLMLLQSD